MLRVARRLALVVALVWLGWSVGRAQTTAPDFELMIDAPPGVTHVQCLRGCTLSPGLVLAPGEPEPRLSISCRGVDAIDGVALNDRCKRRSINGWVKR